MGKPLRVLIVEDSADDAELLVRELKKGGLELEWERVETREAMENALRKKEWDIVIADYKLPKFNAPMALEVLKKSGFDIPFIIVSGTVEEDAVLESMRAGADDYFKKSNLKLIVPAVERELKDAEERKAKRIAQEALRESDRKIRAIFDQTFQFIGMMTVDGTLIEANRTAMRFAGINESDCLGKPFWDTPWWTHSKEMQKKLREAVVRAAKGETIRFEATHRGADGVIHYIDFSLKPFKDENGKVIFMIPEGRDITEQKQATDALRESEEKLRAIVENVHDVIFSCTPDGTITFVTPSVSLYGYSLEDVVGKKLSEFIHPDDLSNVLDELRLAVSEGKEFPSEFRLKKKDGSYFYAEESDRVIKKNGNVVQITGVIRDITDRKRAEIEMKRNQEELSEWSKVLESRVDERTKELKKAQKKIVEQEKLALLGQIAASMSHELRTPLTGIRNSVYLMQMSGTNKAGSKIAENLSLINMEVNACESVLNNMLDFVRPKEPIKKLSRLDAVVNESIGAAIMPTGIKVKTDFEKEIPAVMLDPFQMRQVFDNIVKNAVDAMSTGGELNVTVRTGEKEVVVEFKDTGIGIAAENLSKIFDPLYSTTATGVGLGLTIARQFVEAHGGTIEVESKRGKGTTCRIKLPR